MRICGYHISQTLIVNSDTEATTISPYLEFLLQPKEDTIRVLYHIGYNVANLLKLIGITEQEGKVLLQTTKLHIPPYTLQYIPNKFFSIKKVGGGFTYYSDISQYVKFHNIDLITKEPIELANRARDIGQQIYNPLKELGIEPTSLTSPIRAYEKAVLDKMDLPTVDDIPEETGLYAYECCKNNWVEAFKVGSWDKVWDYDLNNAYPSQIQYLPDTRLGTWEKTKEFNPILGYWKCEVNIKSWFSPIIFIAKQNGNNGNSYTPTGVFETYLTSAEVEFINKYKIGSVDIINGWIWKPKRIVYPLNQQIKWLFNQKENTDNPIKIDCIKRIGSGIYGKFLEQHPEKNEFGPRFNPVWAAEVETNTRLKVAEFVINNVGIDNLIHIAVDGLVCSKPAMGIVNSKRLGEWRLNNIAPCIGIGSGTMAIVGDKDNGDFTLEYSWLKEQMENNKDAGSYQLEKKSPVTLAVAVNEKKWGKIGELKDTTKTVSVGIESKRMYRDRPRNGGELLGKVYDSEPLDIGIIKGIGV